MKKQKYLALILLSSLLPGAGICGVPGHVAEGITLPVTRVIYPESKKNGITFTVTNNTDRVYLLQSRVIPAEEDGESDRHVPFIVVPPLTRFEPGEAVTLLIRQTGKLPVTNKESLWRLALKTIPAQQDNTGTDNSRASLILALQNNLKLFYRPAGVEEMAADEQAEQLQFVQHDGYLTVTNPTPYYITFSELTADGKTVKTEGQRMVPPHGSVRYPAEPAVSVSWVVTGDDGWQTGHHQRSLR